jgi:hypothetical protein
MRIVIFDQWEKLVSLLKSMAASSATERTQYDIVRIVPKDGRAQLADRAMNNLAVEGGATTVVMPDMVPGKAREFMLRVTASGENEIAFAGADAFEGDEGALEPPGDGETVVYFFTETASDVMLVARKAVGRLET